MDDPNDANWSLERERDRTLLYSSSSGTVAANLDFVGESKETWVIDADIGGIEPMSWQIRVSGKEEVLDCVIPEILNEKIPSAIKSRSN
jgi:hypothetical protein